jgi:hypothetical protein
MLNVNQKKKPRGEEENTSQKKILKEQTSFLRKPVNIQYEKEEEQEKKTQNKIFNLNEETEKKNTTTERREKLPVKETYNGLIKKKSSKIQYLNENGDIIHLNQEEQEDIDRFEKIVNNEEKFKSKARTKNESTSTTFGSISDKNNSFQNMKTIYPKGGYFENRWNEIEWIDDKPFRRRCEVLIFDSNNRLFLRKINEDSEEYNETWKYKIPGGGSGIYVGIEDTITVEKETKEEANLNIKNIQNTGVIYTKIYGKDTGGWNPFVGDNIPDWAKEMKAKGFSYYGDYTLVFIAELDGKNLDTIDIIDKDKDIEHNGKFYPVHDILSLLTSNHINAIKSINESLLEETLLEEDKKKEDDEEEIEDGDDDESLDKDLEDLDTGEEDKEPDTKDDEDKEPDTKDDEEIPTGEEDKEPDTKDDEEIPTGEEDKEPDTKDDEEIPTGEEDKEPDTKDGEEDKEPDTKDDEEIPTGEEDKEPDTKDGEEIPTGEEEGETGDSEIPTDGEEGIEGETGDSEIPTDGEEGIEGEEEETPEEKEERLKEKNEKINLLSNVTELNETLKVARSTLTDLLKDPKKLLLNKKYKENINFVTDSLEKLESDVNFFLINFNNNEMKKNETIFIDLKNRLFLLINLYKNTIEKKS